MTNNSLTVFNNNGLELVINTNTGEAFATISGYARMAGRDKSTISRRSQRVASGVIKEVEVLTARSLQKITLIPADIVFDWLMKDNPALAKAMMTNNIKVDKPYTFINQKKTTNKPYLYFILDEQNNKIKIGKSTNPQKRLEALQTSNASVLKLLKYSKKIEEQDIHIKFSQYRVLGEWFDYNNSIQQYIAEL